MHVRRTLSSSAELQGRREQTTKFDLQRRNLRRARINIKLIHTPFHWVQMVGIRHGCPTVAAAADSRSRRGRCDHCCLGRTAEAFHQCQECRQPDPSRHSMLGNFKHQITSDILVPKLFLILIPIPFRRIYFTSSSTYSSEIIIVLVLVPHLQ